MIWSSYGIYGIMVVMLITGAANTILMKHQVRQEVPLEEGGAPEGFDHPFLQTLFMMIGEVGCLIVYWLNTTSTSGGRSLTWGQRALFILPVLCDLTATTLVNYAFQLIPASVVQMTRGAIVLFTCLFSSIFLNRKQERHHILGVSLVCLGIFHVAYATFDGSVGSIVGVSVCFVAQAFQAAMMVTEEKFLGDLQVAPLLAVGLEGVFGCLIIIPATKVASSVGWEDVPGAFYQLSQSSVLLTSVIASIFSIAFFNYSGVTVTKHSSATARSTLDCSRTILVWIFELSFGWSSFRWLQLVGFVMLAVGTMLYNRIIVLDREDDEDDKIDFEKMEKAKLLLTNGTLLPTYNGPAPEQLQGA